MARREVTGKRPLATRDLPRRRLGDADEEDQDEGEDEEEDGDEPSRAEGDEPPRRREASEKPRRRSGGCGVSADPTAIEPSRHAEPDEDDGSEQPRIRGPPLAFSIKQFCQLHAISRELFFKARREGWGPKIMKCGSRTLVSVEAAAEWRRQREEVATAAAAAAA